MLNEANKLVSDSESQIEISLEKYKQSIKQLITDVNYYGVSKAYISMAELILNNKCKDYEKAAQYYDLAAKYYSLDNENQKAGEFSEKAVLTLIENPKNEIKLSHYKYIMRYSINAKNYYGNAGYYEESGKMYQIEMHYRMKRLFNIKKLEPDCSTKDIRESVVKGFFYLMAEKLLGYGESIIRILFTSLSIISIFGIIYLKFDLLTIAKLNYTPKFIDYFYYSAVTFTTLGYGDIVPNLSYLSAKLLSVSEASIGAFTMALIVVVVSRKLSRR